MSTVSVKMLNGALGTMVQPVHFTDRGGVFNGDRHLRTTADIRTFSLASCGRLRKSLCMLRPVYAYRLYGVTLTIPGAVLSPDKVRYLWHSFVLRFRKTCPDVGVVWRVELQTRKQAHYHLICYAHEEKGRGGRDVFRLREIWEDVILRHVLVNVDLLEFERLKAAFLKHGVTIKDLRHGHAAGVISYLVDHQSKHKQDQLGWIGRQWGVLNKGLFVQDSDKDICASVLGVREWLLVRRQFSRLQRKLRYQGVYTGAALSVRRGLVLGACLFGSDEKRVRIIAEGVLFGKISYMPN